MKKLQSIREIQSFVGSLYALKNKDKTPEDIFIYLYKQTTNVSSSILQSHYITNRLKISQISIFNNEIIVKKQEKTVLMLFTYFIKSFSWLFAFSNYLDIDLTDIILDRYPKMCPRCGSIVCKCSSTNMQNFSLPSNHSSSLTKSLFHSKTDIVQSKVVIDSLFLRENYLAIYPANIEKYSLAPHYYASKILEEVVELHEEVEMFFSKRNLEKKQIEEELADLFSWLFVTFFLTFPSSKLEDAIYDYYKLGCPVCNKPTCICEPRMSRPDKIIDVKIIEELLEAVEKYNPPRGQRQDYRSIAIISLQEAIADRSETTFNEALKRVASLINVLKSEDNDAHTAKLKSLMINLFGVDD
jgi:NTP pyrophosphatase (non-canonical NTP hydrolase)